MLIRANTSLRDPTLLWYLEVYLKESLFIWSLKTSLPVKLGGGGLNANKLKYNQKICDYCNNQRTAPFDVAWELLSLYLYNHQHRGSIKLCKIFPSSTHSSMGKVQLYFVKMFGYLISELKLPIPLNSFSKSLLSAKPHSEIYLMYWVCSTPEIN